MASANNDSRASQQHPRPTANWWYVQFRQYNHAYANTLVDTGEHAPVEAATSKSKTHKRSSGRNNR